MGSETCRRPKALRNYLENRRVDYKSGLQIAVFEGTVRLHYNHGDSSLVVNSRGFERQNSEAQDLYNSNNDKSEERVVYSVGSEKPTLGSVLWEAGVTPESIDPHARLDYSVYYQPERLSEALQREREGSLTRRWQGYLRDVRAWFAVEHKVAFRTD